MAEPKKDDVGTTGDGLGEGANMKAAGKGRSAGLDSAKDSANDDDNATASSKGTIASGSGDADLSQASGGSVD